MTLSFPFLMFQGRAQEAIDHYLETFPDAELLAIQHHLEGTEIFDPATEQAEDDETGQEPEGSEQDAGEEPEEDAEKDSEDESADEAADPADEAAEADSDEESEEPPVLVATAQLKIGSQVLMLQDSLVKHTFTFTPSTSIAVVVDSASEFDHIVDKLAEGGQYLMEPGSYDFAQNYAWVTDRFGFSWQVNHPLSTPEETTQAKAPEWG
ncbi:VOC family protein [Nesterenkonia cremea]|uniref:PhnB-like domain-containing protein n=1 Tax=Nesterenkonia cremea TaxID=1882340 RepID=A0A917EPI3_9MICC|nr:VOC family protein [Nesterenkonia cremea]GGE71455.1 hypothetical protein GCM10011401_18160 [Nesterenkonia cremea]